MLDHFVEDALWFKSTEASNFIQLILNMVCSPAVELCTGGAALVKFASDSSLRSRIQ